MPSAQGKERDWETGLDYVEARYYRSVAEIPGGRDDPAIGICRQVDPLWEKMPDINPYHYTHNDPVNRVDPNGLQSMQYFKNAFGFVAAKDQSIIGRLYRADQQDLLDEELKQITMETLEAAANGSSEVAKWSGRVGIAFMFISGGEGIAGAILSFSSLMEVISTAAKGTKHAMNKEYDKLIKDAIDMGIGQILDKYINGSETLTKKEKELLKQFYKENMELIDELYNKAEKENANQKNEKKDKLEKENKENNNEKDKREGK